MDIGNTVTVTRTVELDADGLAVATTYRASLRYDDGDSGRDVTAVLDAAVAQAVFTAVGIIAKTHFAGRAGVLTSVAEEAVALSKEVK